MGSHRVRHDWSDTAAAAAAFLFCPFFFRGRKRVGNLSKVTSLIKGRAARSQSPVLWADQDISQPRCLTQVCQPQHLWYLELNHSLLTRVGEAGIGILWCLGSIPGFYPLNASSTSPFSCDNQECLLTLPTVSWKSKLAPFENYWHKV